MKHTPESLMAFEKRVADLFETGDLPFLMHLSGGNEQALIDLFTFVSPGDWVLSNHRSHYHYVLTGGSEAMLEGKIRTGKSMFVFDSEINFMSSSVLGGMCGIAAGLALGLKDTGKSVWCFVGDGAEDNGHLYEAVKHVQSQKLPCKFIIEDNDRSCGVSKDQRGSDYVMRWPSCVMRIGYAPTWPHAGTGTPTKVVFNKDVVNRFAR